MFSLNNNELDQMIQALEAQKKLSPAERELEGLKSPGIFAATCAAAAGIVYGAEKLYKKLKL